MGAFTSYVFLTDLVRGEILTEETAVKANISLSSTHILSIGGEKL